MVQVIDTAIAGLGIDELKTKIKRLNSKAGQMKMDLHDLAEGLPTDYETLMDVAAQTYDIFHQIDKMKKQLIILEQNHL
ncbi:MAG: CCE_0567 family metalloprotein [Pseudanabaena sp. ELA748]